MEKAHPTKRQRYDAAFRAEALRLANESRSTLTAARALNIGQVAQRIAANDPTALARRPSGGR